MDRAWIGTDREFILEDGNRGGRLMTRYPTCLAHLTLLQSPLFRERLRDPIFAKDIERIGVRHHETWCVISFPSRGDDTKQVLWGGVCVIGKLMIGAWENSSLRPADQRMMGRS